jgi:hypothetical protein
MLVGHPSDSFLHESFFEGLLDMENQEEWIGAARALILLKPAMAGFIAKKTICTRAHNGLVRARAQRYMQGNTIRDNHDVPAQFWWAGGEAALEQNWVTGDFETWIEHRHHLKAFGVSFLRTDLEKMLPEGVGSEESAPVVGSHIVPYELLRGRRRYLETLARQINGCYQLGYYDGCAVISRRLLECLLILAFEKCGHTETLRDAAGDYKPLSELISLASSGQYIKLARGSASVLLKVKQLGDVAAHHPTYNTRQSDIDDLRVSYGALISELAHLGDVTV